MADSTTVVRDSVSVFGSVQWDDTDALNLREFFASFTGRRLAANLVLLRPGPVSGTKPPEQVLGEIAGHALALQQIDNFFILPGTLRADGTPDPRAQPLPSSAGTALPDLDAPLGAEEWGGDSDPANKTA